MSEKRIQIEYIELKALRPYERNPRKNDDAVAAVAASIREFGFKVPMVIDRENVIVCGHTRYKAAKMLKMQKVPCIRADDLTEEQIKALRLVDNKTAELSTWDEGLLAEEMELCGEIFDMTEFGFALLDDDAEQDFSAGKEIDPNEYAEREFEYECPECGFHFNV